LNYLLIPYFGYEASAATTLFVYFYMCLFAYFTGQKHYKVNYDIKRISYYLILTLVLLLIGLNLNLQSMAYTQMIRELLVLLYIGVVFMFERKRIRNSIN